MKLTFELIIRAFAVCLACGGGWAQAQHFPVPGPLAADCPPGGQLECKALEAAELAVANFQRPMSGPKPREFPGLEPHARKRTVVEQPAYEPSYEPLFADGCEEAHEKFRTEERRVDRTWNA